MYNDLICSVHTEIFSHIFIHVNFIHASLVKCIPKITFKYPKLPRLERKSLYDAY